MDGSPVGAGVTAQPPEFFRGCLLVVLAGAVLSLGVFCIRNTAGTEAWVYIFWRATGFTTALVTIAALRGTSSPLRQLAGLRPIAGVAALGMALSQVTFVSAVKIATFAEVFLICSLAPLVAALLAWPVLSERLNRWSAAAIVLGIAGVGIMTGGGAASTAAGGQLGLVLAVMSMLGFAAYTLCTRGSSAQDLDAMLIAVGLLTAGAGAIATQVLGLSLLASTQDALIAFAHGGLLLSAGLFLFGQGSRTIDAVTFTMLAQAEAVISPLWGYLFFRETPSPATLLGGAVILVAIMLQAATAPRPNVSSD
jgi:drug/metabolite transporter, DME family